MATTNYILQIASENGSNARFIVSYRAGKFFKLERKSGKIVDKIQWNRLMMIIPEKEQSISTINKNFDGRVTYEKLLKESPKSLFKQLMQEFFVFYEQKTEVKPRFNGTDGNSLKMIIAHLKSICADDAEVIAVWKSLLTNWHKIEDFYAKQIELRQINSNLNILIRQVKNGFGTNQAQKAANSNAAELRKSL